MTATTLELRERDELRRAARALLRQPFVAADDAAFPLVRRHEPELVRRFAHFWGYLLDVTPGFARLYKRPTDAALRRPLRIPPGTPSGRRRPRDEWPRLDRRRATLLFLTIAALERSRRQTVVGDLARDVAEAGSSCDPSLEVDFDQRSERLAFADALDLLCHWRILRLDDGSRASFATRAPGEDEALFTIDRKRLASLLRDPFRSLVAQGADDLADDGDAYAATDDGTNLRIRHRLARMLAEDPVLYVDRLSEDERAYFHRQRAYLENLVADYTGLVPERRLEGTACIEPERTLTDLPFPANSTRKQAALLLCDVLAPAGTTVLTREELRRAMHALVERHGASWNRDPDDAVEVDALLDDALDVLADLDLVELDDDGVRPLPLCGRFRDPRINRPQQED
ncbi:MAG: TIGR02678 family protein [Gaiellaceae bacterium]